MVSADFLVDFNEPLLGGAEDDGLVASPAVRVAVIDVAAAHQDAALFEEFDYRFVGFEDSQAFVLGQSVAQTAGVVDVAGLIEAVLFAGVEVVGSVGGCGVDGAGALVGGNVVSEHAEDAAIKERMLEGGAFELCTLEPGHFDGGLELAGLGDGSAQSVGNDVYLAVLFDALRYSSSGWKATANDAGSVHGVVVQMMVETVFPASAGSIAAGSLVSAYFT